MKLINNKGIPTLIISEEEAFVVKNFIDTIFTSDFVGQDDSITRVAIEDFPCGEIVKSGRKYHGLLYVRIVKDENLVKISEKDKQDNEG